MKPGQILEDTSVYKGKHGDIVFATVIEDADTVDFSNEGFTIQESETPCPSCGRRVNIRLVHPSLFNEERCLCLYCGDCHLLFRKAAIAYITWDGKYEATKGFE